MKPARPDDFTFYETMRLSLFYIDNKDSKFINGIELCEPDFYDIVPDTLSPAHILLDMAVKVSVCELYK